MTVRGAAVFLALVLAAPVQAAQPEILGAWRITDAQVAPWAQPDSGFSAEEEHRLVGSTLTFAKARITGLRPLSCQKPHYHFLDVPPDYLFQGGLTDPAAQAMALGFHPPKITTLETGCAGWIDFHFVDARTAMFGLNNRIYSVRKQ